MHFRKLKLHDAASIAKVHVLSFESFFLTSLGKGFLTEFYRAVIDHENGCGIGAFEGDELIGFAVGTKSSKGFYKSVIRKRGISLLINALPNLLISPSKIIRILMGLSSSVSNKDYAKMPSLLSICVSPAATTNGVGTRLIEGFQKELVQSGLTDVILTTDKHNNEQVNLFYLRNGYICTNSFLQGKREMNFYHKKL